MNTSVNASASTAACAIRLRNVDVDLRGSVLLADIDLQIEQGERVAIVGSNGAGKSTLLKLCAGTIMVSRGDIHVLGLDLQRPLAVREQRWLHEQTGQILQGVHLVARLTVLENVLLGCLARNRSMRTWARLFPAVEIGRAEVLLATVGLAGRGAMRADRLSGGERQKVAIARMLLQRPRLILADEPTSALDPAAAIAIAETLSASAKNRGATIVTVVHEPDLLPAVADRVIGLRGGRIAFDLPVALVTKAMLDALYGNLRPTSSGSGEDHAVSSMRNSA